MCRPAEAQPAFTRTPLRADSRGAAASLPPARDKSAPVASIPGVSSGRLPGYAPAQHGRFRHHRWLSEDPAVPCCPSVAVPFAKPDSLFWMTAVSAEPVPARPFASPAQAT